jgi:hypothetical protein
MNAAFSSFPADLAERMQALAAAGLDINFILKLAGELGAQAPAVFADIQTLLSGGFSLAAIVDIWNRASPIAAEIFAQLAAHKPA